MVHMAATSLNAATKAVYTMPSVAKATYPALVDFVHGSQRRACDQPEASEARFPGILSGHAA